MDKMLQDALANLGRYGNSFGQSDRMRAKWTQGLQPAVKDARREAVEYLWFVGDYASYNATLTDVTRKTAEVFQKTGLNFGILYDGERNAGNDVRRVGEEGLFEMLADKNSQVLAKASSRPSSPPIRIPITRSRMNIRGTGMAVRQYCIMPNCWTR